MEPRDYQVRLLFELPARSPQEAVEAYLSKLIDFGLTGWVFAAEDMTTNEITLWTGHGEQVHPDDQTPEELATDTDYFPEPESYYPQPDSL